MNPLQLLREATKAVPAVRYALGVVGIVATIAIVRGFHLQWSVALIGTLVLFVFMIILVVFAQVAQAPSGEFRLPVLVITWFVIVLFMASASVLFSSVFFNRPDLGFHQKDIPKPPAPAPNATPSSFHTV